MGKKNQAPGANVTHVGIEFRQDIGRVQKAYAAAKHDEPLVEKFIAEVLLPMFKEQFGAVDASELDAYSDLMKLQDYQANLKSFIAAQKHDWQRDVFHAATKRKGQRFHRLVAELLPNTEQVAGAINKSGAPAGTWVAIGVLPDGRVGLRVGVGLNEKRSISAANFDRQPSVDTPEYGQWSEPEDEAEEEEAVETVELAAEEETAEDVAVEAEEEAAMEAAVEAAEKVIG